MQFPYGEITVPPPFFAPPEMWPEFGHVATPPNICAREEVGVHPKGIRWSLWPITFEEYVGDLEPDIAAAKSGALARNRLVMWKRLHDTGPIRGWRSLSKKPSRIDGYYVLSKDKEYTADWSKSARRDLREWQKKYLHSKCIIEAITVDEFVEAYKKSTVAKKTHAVFLEILRRKQQLPACRENSTMWGVRDIATGNVIAGNVNYYSPTYGSSVREFPFILPEARGGHASVALMDHWMSEARKRGHYILLATHFWQPGEPRSWKGFSAFKAQFGYTYVACPPTLWKFVGGKIF